MKISELIKRLEALKTEHGDLEVTTPSFNGRPIDVNPRIAFQRVNNSRQRLKAYASEIMKDTKGDKVIRV